jgi:hypothetical protein
MPVLNLLAYPRDKWSDKLQIVMLDPAGGPDGPLSDAIEASRLLFKTQGRLGAAVENHLQVKAPHLLSRAMWRGYQAGYVLLFTLARAEAGEKRKGVKDALKKMESTLKKRTGWRGGGGETDLKATWRNFRPVAHLWAAQSMGAMFKLGDDPQVLREWIAGAEDLRRRGEAFRPLTGKTPALDPGTTWRMPDELALPSSTLELPSVDTIISKIISGR